MRNSEYKSRCYYLNMAFYTSSTVLLAFLHFLTLSCSQLKALKPTLPLRTLSVEELCAEMRDLKLDYCTPAFEKEGVDGAALVEASQNEFMDILTSNGHPWSQLPARTHIPDVIRRRLLTHISDSIST